MGEISKFSTADLDLPSKPDSTPDYQQDSAHAGDVPTAPAPTAGGHTPGDPLDAHIANFDTVLKGFRTEKQVDATNAEAFKQRRAEIELKLPALNQQAREARASLSKLVEQSSVFHNMKWNNVWSREGLWGPKAEAMQKRMELSRQVDAMMAHLKSEGVADDHETMKALHDLRTEATPDPVSRGTVNTIEYGWRNPVTISVIGAAALGANWLLKKAMGGETNDSWWKKLLRWGGVGLAASWIVNYKSENDRKNRAAAAAEAEKNKTDPFPTSPQGESYAHNLEDPDNPRYAWSRSTPTGTVEFRYPGPSNMPFGGPIYGPQMPQRPMPPQAVNPGYYFNPNMYGARPPQFMPQQSYPPYGYGPQAGPYRYQ